ncbi:MULTISPECIES: diaminopimelate epimerase [unclassified Streptomyces]|uniref:diaminopimelate epimerase n=1 Tax=unclassified Streptomyces TaxID=2593676 RepID=UPI002E2A07F9|nr:diaminopimelate epimerase [Streptomyces sp. NBC_01429]
MSHLSIAKTHGSRNDIFVIDGAPDDHFASGDVTRAVERLCDRKLGLGSDGVYFLADNGDGSARAWFFNPDGSPALLCGNGMRCAGRLLLDKYGADSAVVHTGPYSFTVRNANFTPQGVRQVAVELPSVEFSPAEPLVAGVRRPFVGQVFPPFHTERAVTALAVPNSHLVTVVDAYDEAELVETGSRVAADPEAFPIGANVSFVLPLADDEVFVHTFERGAGLTPSCGSGVAASRAVTSRLGLVDPDVALLIRNPGGPARSWLQEHEGRWQPVLEGNATVVYRTEIDPAALLNDGPLEITGETYLSEIEAFDALFQENLKALRAAGVSPTII